MKTVLIVEDEKLIRQGIKTMVLRSGVPVEIIMECSNGEAALEIVKEQKIDVMFTDIRMPKMDGIELVREIEKLEEKPFIVAISGYDDFSYAVEMLRNGVREYILKPVEREKITEILKKLQREIDRENQQNQTEIRVGKKQIKYLLANENPSEEEVSLLEKKYEDHFFKNGYVICIAGKQFELEESEEILFVDDVAGMNMAVVEQEILPVLMKNELFGEAAGISRVHLGLRELKIAYREAYQARKTAFYLRDGAKTFGEVSKEIPEGLMQQIMKLFEDASWLKLLQLIGTNKTEELGNQWSILFEEMKRGRVPAEKFEEGMQNYLTELEKIYRSIVGEQEQKCINRCRNIYEFSDVGEYQDYFMGMIFEIHNKINDKEDDSKNQQKIKMAVEYVRENYNSDLNMAVVSNQISMNYSLFSYAFKQYTGSNFVNFLKDIRMKEAEKLLSETDDKIIEISQQVGYENEKHFMKIFKGVYGVSPSEFRKNMRHKD